MSRGYIVGENIEILEHEAGNRYDLLPEMAADLVRRRVAVIFAEGGIAPALAAKSATATIPIVFENGGDPVEFGLVASLNRPGGNVTGVTFLTTTLVAKRLELLHELVPAKTSVGFLVNPAAPQVRIDTETSEAENAARILGMKLSILKASNVSEFRAVFETLLRQRLETLLIDADPLFLNDQLIEMSTRYAIPTIYYLQEQAEAGGLMSYGANLSDAYRLAGSYVGRILKGEKPADLPVQQSTRIEMVLNLKTAKALGIEVPTATLLRATEVIE